MIDWVTAVIPVVHDPIYGGQVISFDADGIEEWNTPKRVMAIGSYEKRIAIKSGGADGQGKATELWISGNPSKFLQGHNVFGSDDIISLMFDTFKIIAHQFHLQPNIAEWQLIKMGEYPVQTVDINYSFTLPTRSDVLAFIRALEFRAKTRHGRPSSKGGTLYFGKTSEYWAFKFYCKAEEIKTSKGCLPEHLKNIGIEAWADNKLRAELRLKSKQLKRLGIINAKDLHQELVRQLFNDYIRQIDMSEQVILKDSDIEQLPNKLKLTYSAWKDGKDVRQYMSKRTYERHRKELKEFGINIDLTTVKQEQSNVVPFLRILEAQPAEVPDWAFSKGVVHHSAKVNLG